MLCETCLDSRDASFAITQRVGRRVDRVVAKDKIVFVRSGRARQNSRNSPTIRRPKASPRLRPGGSRSARRGPSVRTAPHAPCGKSCSDNGRSACRGGRFRNARPRTGSFLSASRIPPLDIPPAIRRRLRPEQRLPAPAAANSAAPASGPAIRVRPRWHSARCRYAWRPRRR